MKKAEVRVKLDRPRRLVFMYGAGGLLKLDFIRIRKRLSCRSDAMQIDEQLHLTSLLSQSAIIGAASYEKVVK